MSETEEIKRQIADLEERILAMEKREIILERTRWLKNPYLHEAIASAGLAGAKIPEEKP